MNNKEPTICELINEILELNPNLKKSKLWSLTKDKLIKKLLKLKKEKEEENENNRREI